MTSPRDLHAGLAMQQMLAELERSHATMDRAILAREAYAMADAMAAQAARVVTPPPEDVSIAAAAWHPMQPVVAAAWHPMQPVVAATGRASDAPELRFSANAIVRYLLDHGGIDLNRLAQLPFSVRDREQFAQLIGYSLSGFCELPYVSDATRGIVQTILDFKET